MGGNKRKKGGLRFKGPLCVTGATKRVCRMGTPGCVIRHMHVDSSVLRVAISFDRALTDDELAAATSPTS